MFLDTDSIFISFLNRIILLLICNNIKFRLHLGHVTNIPRGENSVVYKKGSPINSTRTAECNNSRRTGISIHGSQGEGLKGMNDYQLL
jgi:hypothetical protein